MRTISSLLIKKAMNNEDFIRWQKEEINRMVAGEPLIMPNTLDFFAMWTEKQPRPLRTYINNLFRLRVLECRVGIFVKTSVMVLAAPAIGALAGYTYYVLLGEYTAGVLMVAMFCTAYFALCFRWVIADTIDRLISQW